MRAWLHRVMMQEHERQKRKQNPGSLGWVHSPPTPLVCLVMVSLSNLRLPLPLFIRSTLPVFLVLGRIRRLALLVVL